MIYCGSFLALLASTDARTPVMSVAMKKELAVMTLKPLTISAALLKKTIWDRQTRRILEIQYWNNSKRKYSSNAPGALGLQVMCNVDVSTIYKPRSR